MSPVTSQYDRTIDAELATAVTQLLQRQNRPALRAIRVSVRRRTVTLRGNVPSYHDRQLVLEAVRQVAGVLRIFDELKVTRELPVPETASLSSSARKATATPTVQSELSRLSYLWEPSKSAVVLGILLTSITT